VKPYWSDNLYLELDITNLSCFYERAKKDRTDINKYFGITPATERAALTEVVAGRRKSEARINFEERCFLTKITFPEVIGYLEMQKTRVKDIEAAIDTHFDLVKREILKSYSDKLYRAMRNDQADARRAAGGNQTERGATTKNSKTKRKGGGTADEEAVMSNAIKEQLSGDPDLQFENPYVCTYSKKLSQLYEYEEQLLRVDRTQKSNRRGLQTICRMQGSLSQSYFLWDAQKYKIARKVYYELENQEKELEEDNWSEVN